MTTDPKTWNDLARQCADLQAENAELRKKIDTQTQTDCPYCHEIPTIEPNLPDGCEYFTGQKSICTVKCGKRTIAWLYTDDDVLVAEYQDGSIPEMRKKINYCPMCGAKMGVE
jgi:hypothetical protein